MCAKLPYAPNDLSVWQLLNMQNTQEKANLQKMKVNATKARKVHANGN